MTELLTKSLAQIVNGNHRAAAVFEKFHLDFCCKGKRTLQEACAESDLKIEEVVNELQEADLNSGYIDTINYDELSLTQLADHIVNTHHVFVKKEIPLILGYLQKVSAKHGDRHPEMKKVLDLFATVSEELEQHMLKEEQILFPRIKEVDELIAEKKEITVSSAWLLSPIHVMEEEHDLAGNLLSETRILTNNYTPPVDACTTFRLSLAALQAFEMDLHQHVHLENNVLFPKALGVFKIAENVSLN